MRSTGNLPLEQDDSDTTIARGLTPASANSHRAIAHALNGERNGNGNANGNHHHVEASANNDELINLLNNVPGHLIQLESAQELTLPILKNLFAQLSALTPDTPVTPVTTPSLTNSQKRSLAEAKLLLMKAAFAKLPIDPNAVLAPPDPPPTYLQYFSAAGLVLLGLCYTWAEAFTGSFDLASNLFGLIELTSVIISVLSVVVSSLLFLTLEARGFISEAGFSSHSNVWAYQKTLHAKLEIAEAFSKALRNPLAELRANKDNYKSNFELLKLFQADIKKDHDDLVPSSSFTNDYVLPTFRFFFSLVGAGLFALSGVIISRDLLANFAAISFIGALPFAVAAPVWAILTVAGFAMFYALQNRSSLDMFNALRGYPKELIDSQKKFTDEVDVVNDNINLAIVNIENQEQIALHDQHVQQYQNQIRELKAQIPAVSRENGQSESSQSRYYGASSTRTLFNSSNSSEASRISSNDNSVVTPSRQRSASWSR